MKYVERVLQPGETVVYLTSLHWLVYCRAVLLLVLALIVFIASTSVDQRGVALGLEILAGVLLVVAAISGLRALIQRATTELAVTDRRVIYKVGIFQRHTMEMN